jgi:hypothetical protein
MLFNANGFLLIKKKFWTLYAILVAYVPEVC